MPILGQVFVKCLTTHKLEDNRSKNLEDGAMILLRNSVRRLKKGSVPFYFNPI